MCDATEQFGEVKDADHLGWDTTVLGKWLWVFERNVQPSSSGAQQSYWQYMEHHWATSTVSLPIWS